MRNDDRVRRGQKGRAVVTEGRRIVVYGYLPMNLVDVFGGCRVDIRVLGVRGIRRNLRDRRRDEGGRENNDRREFSITARQRCSLSSSKQRDSSFARWEAQGTSLGDLSKLPRIACFRQVWFRGLNESCTRLEAGGDLSDNVVICCRTGLL